MILNIANSGYGGSLRKLVFSKPATKL